MEVISFIIGIVGLIRQVWGLFRDIKRNDPDFRAGKMTQRCAQALKVFREEGNNLGELKALCGIVAEKHLTPPPQAPESPR